MAKNATPGAAASGAGSDSAPASYETALEELETLVARMEGGTLSLEDSLGAYRRGAVLVAFCQQQLDKVEQQVRVLDGAALKPHSTGVAATDGEDDDL
ncbi:exodeoxyribonuclease VII small subunit [Burkholderia perseverans]|uniref:exodeoxyribonuclease VII small subunit n=1 Tax=Burkholderia perseverans TaxID=2615214 RepID=UPI001FED97C9|nr:exodeoxyribonuclease VII small subunit [Burkholderia perseverans]